MNRFNRIVRAGVYLIAPINRISIVGYAMFPLTQAGVPGRFQDAIEHVMDVLMPVSDRVVVINSGRLLMQGTPQEALFSIVFPAHFRYNTFGACFECVCIFRMPPTTGLTSTSAKASAASGVM